ncbi:MAG: GNAT family N-acetyltransferase [Pseudomonadota bacterium]
MANKIDIASETANGPEADRPEEFCAPEGGLAPQPALTIAAAARPAAPGRAAGQMTSDLANALLSPSKLHDPAPLGLWTKIHEALAAEGETPPLEEMPAFALERCDETGALRAALAGEMMREALHLSHLWVDARYRRHGLGGDLLALAEAHAAGCGVRRVFLETRSEYARSFFEKRGYAVCGELKNYSGAQSLYVMEKLFSPLT